ncbi:unnamed protein product [Effrenium voratum]|nr:unnamed protein product [Effrenium voratum]
MNGLKASCKLMRADDVDLQAACFCSVPQLLLLLSWHSCRQSSPFALRPRALDIPSCPDQWFAVAMAHLATGRVVCGDLKTCARRQLWDQALQVLADAQQRSTEPGPAMYSSTTSACRGRWERALRLLDDVQKLGIELLIISHNTALCSLHWPLGLGLVTDMAQCALRVDAATCGGLVAQLGKAAQWRTALAAATGLGSANVVSCNALLDCCVRARQWQVALAVLRRMQGAMQPDAISYSSVISGCTEEAWPLALALLGEAVVLRALDTMCCTAALRACAQGQGCDICLRSWDIETGTWSRYFVAMVLPMSLLRTAQNQPMMVELKNGETYSGVLASCDGFMNLHMRDIVCTSRDGERFWKIPECYVRGNSIKYLRLPDEVIDMVKDEPTSRKEIRQQFKARGRGRGKGEGRGRGGRGQAPGPGEKRGGGGADKAGKKARG